MKKNQKCKSTQLHKLMCMLLVLVFFCLADANAQQTVPASGGKASGSGGTVSYSVGQVFYSIFTGETGSASEGVQQPYEISVVTGIPEAEGIDLVVSAFPNPVTDHLILRVEHYDPENLSFQLFDVNGRMVQTGQVVGPETIIDMTGQTRAVYLLRVLDNEKEIKTFRILKF